MSTTYAPSLRIELGPATAAAAGLLTLCLLALTAVWLSAAGPLWATLLSLALLLHLATLLRRLHGQPRLLEWDAAGYWWLHGDGEPRQGELLGSARLGCLLVLRLGERGHRHALLLTPDRADAATLRRLRARLLQG